MTKGKSTKVCTKCQKSKATSSFFKISTDLAEDGRMAICSECTAQRYNMNSHKDVLALLRKLDRPFLKHVWDNAKSTYGDKFTFGRYLSQISSQKKYRDYTYTSSDHLGENGEETHTLDDVERIINENGDEIAFSEKLVFEWGGGFSTLEYLKLEKFYQDSLNQYRIETSIDKDQLRTLIKTSIRRDRALENQDINAFEKLSKQYDAIMKSQSFRPQDRQGKDQQAGIRSFSQLFSEVERDGYVAPQKEVINRDVEDIYDRMIISILNYYNRIVGIELLDQVPDEDKEFYADSFSDEESEMTEAEKAEVRFLQADLNQEREIMNGDTDKKVEQE